MKLDKFNSFVLSTWKGEQPLWLPFWVHGFGIGCALGAFFTPIALERLFLVSEFANNPANLNQPFFLLQAYGLVTLFSLWLTYYIWNFVATWRSASKAKALCWPVRAFVAAVAFSYWGLMFQYAYALFF